MFYKLWRVWALVVALGISLAAVGLGGNLAAAAKRGILFTANYTNVVISKGGDARLTLKVTNTGEVGEFIDLLIASVPRGWQARFSDYSFDVRSIYIPPGKDQDVDLRAKPADDVPPGDYTFPLRAVSQDGQVEASLKIIVGLQTEAVATQDRVKLVTIYPSMSTPSGTPLQFNIDLTNQGKTDRTFELPVKAPPQWTVSVQPAYETKQITTISLKADETKGVNLVLTPPGIEKPGTYPVTFQARSGAIQDTLDLKVEVTGTYDLMLTTSTGRLNAEVTAGREGVLSMLLVNTGSANVNNISFTSEKPEGWSITFEPDKLDSLATRSFREINAKIKAPDRTIAGDYSIKLTAMGDRAFNTKEFRVTVSTPTKWGAVGIGIVVVVIAGLAGVFIRVGRR